MLVLSGLDGVVLVGLRFVWVWINYAFCLVIVFCCLVVMLVVCLYLFLLVFGFGAFVWCCLRCFGVYVWSFQCFWRFFHLNLRCFALPALCCCETINLCGYCGSGFLVWFSVARLRV